MIQLKAKDISEYRKTIKFVNPKCKHEQSFEYSVPWTCQDPNCFLKLPAVDKLYGPKNQGTRVKYFAEGKL